jgi:2-polyprenyl-3-methyl-5-hydroxy-6-metoxy-1,4-benzoquinol methylase
MFNFDSKKSQSTRSIAKFEGPVGWVKSFPTTFQPSSFESRDILGVSLHLLNGHNLSEKDEVARNTEVLPFIYEGGMKVWEASFDLLEYLSSNHSRIFSSPIEVMELGCGSGIVSIWLIKRFSESISRLVFHDLNESVIKYLTYMNLSRNCPDFLGKAQFACGPWNSECELGQYDLILSAETLYNVDYYLDLVEQLRCSLRKPNGKAILASKRFYFGVGGGTTEFIAFVHTTCPSFYARVVSSVSNGSSNVRDVVELGWKI